MLAGEQTQFPLVASRHLVVSRCDLAEFQLKRVLKCASHTNREILAKTSTAPPQMTLTSFEKKTANTLFQMSPITSMIAIYFPQGCYYPNCLPPVWFALVWSWFDLFRQCLCEDWRHVVLTPVNVANNSADYRRSWFGWCGTPGFHTFLFSPLMHLMFMSVAKRIYGFMTDV